MAKKGKAKTGREQAIGLGEHGHLTRCSTDGSALDKCTIETLNDCLAMPGNESTIQAVAMGILVDMNQIFQSRLAYAIFEGKFSSEMTLPILPGVMHRVPKLAGPWPD